MFVPVVLPVVPVSTNVEQRQRMMDRFNRDDKIFAFILSTRSGGLGINLIGADSVIFYDTDWNPAMDAQAQDRAHRIGQTRDVHIYRLVTAHTIEENILNKANQKREMNTLAIEEGNFSTEFFNNAEESAEGDLKDFFAGTGVEEMVAGGKNDGDDEEEEGGGSSGGSSSAAIRLARAAAEDESDRQAATSVRNERVGEVAEFDETKQLSSSASGGTGGGTGGGGGTSTGGGGGGGTQEDVQQKEAREDAKLEEHLRQLWKGDGNALQVSFFVFLFFLFVLPYL